MKPVTLLLSFTLLVATGCSTMRDSLIVGTTTGMATGAAAGAALSKNNKNQGALKGALITGAIGGIASYFIHKGLKKRDSKVRKDTLFNLEKFGVGGVPQNFSNNPYLTKPAIDSQWVDTRVEGKKLIEGHRVWVITEDSKWLPNQKPQMKSK